MARLARGEYLDPDEVQVVHAVQRCVRRAFLCGKDPLSGQSYEHRRLWIRTRLEFLASAFGVDCLTYAILSNHLHVVLRSRPDVVATWSDEEIARRWLRLFPTGRQKADSSEQPTDAELQMITGDAQRLVELRRRLSDISWWMRCTAEDIAKQANCEDECTGRFWEGRFKAQLLLDEASLLACVAYVDLNPIRATLANSPEESEFTGAKDRIDDLGQYSGEEYSGEECSISESSKSEFKCTHEWERSCHPKKSGWMSPLEINEQTDPVGPDPGRSHIPDGSPNADRSPNSDGSPNSDRSPRRPSQKGFLPMSLAEYLELLDWTGRQLHRSQRGVIPANLAPILTRIGMETKSWCDLVSKFGRLFKRAAGTAESLTIEANRRGVRYLHAPGCHLLGNAA